MKILAITADIYPEKLGGAETHFVEILKRLAPKLEKVTVITGPNRQIEALFKKFPQVKIVPVWYPHIPNLYGLLFILFSLPVVAIESLKEHHDLIWAKQEFPQSQVGAVLKILTGIPLYVTSQNPRLNHEEMVIKGPLKRFANILSQAGSPLISWALGQASIVAAVSQYSAHQAKIMGAKEVIVIPNGVDLSQYQNIHPQKHKTFNIVTTSSLIPRNGLDTLIEACALLPKNINWRLTIAGDGPEQKKLEELVRDQEIDNRVLFLGRVANYKIPELLANGDVFVRPSRFEGFGSSFIEAMAIKLPVIGTNVGGLADFLISGKTGLVVSPNNPKQLAKEIERIHANPQLRSELVKQAHQMVSDRYSWDRIADQVYAQISRLVQK